MKRKRPRVSEYKVQLDPAQLAQLELQLAERLSPKKKLGPEFNAFAERFIEWSISEKQKPSSVAAKEMVLRVHLRPQFAGRLLGQLVPADVVTLKAKLASRKPKTVNNVLSVLRRLLKLAVQLGELDQLPVHVAGVKLGRAPFAFYDFVEYERLVEGAARVSPQHLVLVLLGGDAGLRMGEMLALEWSDVELRRRQLVVRRSDWYGKISTPKNGHARVVPLTSALISALEETNKQTNTGRVLGPLSVQKIRRMMREAQLAARLEDTGRLHVLRHTFCSHLAMHGGSLPAIRELAGHLDDSTTSRYVHLARAEGERTIGLLDSARAGSRGETTRESL